MTDTNVDQQKISVYNAYGEGRSKASLAVEHEVSPRTIGRWIDDVQASGYSKPVEVVKASDKSTDKRYLAARIKSLSGESNQDIADSFGVSESTVRRWVAKAKAEAEEFRHEFTEFVSSNEPLENVQPQTEYKYNASSRSIAITQIDQGGLAKTLTADKKADNFLHILDSLMEAQFSQESLAEAFSVLQPALALEKFSQGKIQVDPQNRAILYLADEDTVPYKVDNQLTDRVIQMLRDGEGGVQTLLNFLEKLMENPSRRAVNELYGFLQANDIEITEDGDFFAWKKVRSDYLDIHSGTMDNSVGTSPRVARNMVDEDSNVTCSYGLHVCSKSYLPHFGDTHSSRILKVKVDPRDVVAVPADYHNAKMRTAGYLVVEDVTNAHYGRVEDEVDDEEEEDDYNY